jgi:hypothetical protein
MAKSTSTECSACGEKFKVTSTSMEPVAYCPFCADPALLTPDEPDDEDDGEDDDDLHEFDPDDI